MSIVFDIVSSDTNYLFCLNSVFFNTHQLRIFAVNCNLYIYTQNNAIRDEIGDIIYIERMKER